MKWDKPERGTPSWEWHIVSQCKRFYISKALVNGSTVYTLADKSELVLSGTLDECKSGAIERVRK